MRIELINYIMAYILIFYNIKIEKRINYCYCNCVKMIKKILDWEQKEVEFAIFFY